MYVLAKVDRIFSSLRVLIDFSIPPFRYNASFHINRFLRNQNLFRVVRSPALRGIILKNKLFLVLLITIALSQLSVTGMAKLETIKVGNHTVSMNIPDLPQYYISSTVLGSEEAIEIKFNESLLKTLLIESSRIQISIYDAGEGIYLTNITDLKKDLINWGENNYPGGYSVYTKNIAGNPGVILEHPYSSVYKNMQVLEADSFLDFDSANKAHSKLYIYSTYDRIVTGAIMDSMIIKKNK